MDHYLAHALRQFLAGAIATALTLALAPHKAAAADAAVATDTTLKVFIPNPQATRQVNDPSGAAPLKVLDQQLARDTNVTDSTDSAARAAGTESASSAPAAGNPLGGTTSMPEPVQKIVSTLIAPLSASLSVVDSMLDDTHHLVVSMADQWVESQKPPAPQPDYAAAAPAAPAPQAGPTTVSSVYPQAAYAAAPPRAAYPQDPAAAVFADGSQPVVVYYPSAPQPMAYYPPPQPYYPPQYYPPQPYYYPPQAYYQPAPAYAPPPQPAQVAMAAPAPQYAAPLPPASAYVVAAPQPPVLPAAQKPHAIITVANSPDPTFIVHRSSTGGTMPSSIVPPAVAAADYAQLEPAAGSPDDGPPPMPPINAPAASAPTTVHNGPSVFEATVSGPAGTKSNADGSTAAAAAAATAAAPSPLLSSESSEPEPELSPDTKKTISHIPSGIDSKSKETEHLQVSHQKERVAKATDKPGEPPLDAAVDTGKPRVDVQYDLQQGYSALIAGDTEAAIHIYANVLDNDPDNKQALFALGTAYQRVGQIDKARPYYIHLLKIDPSNRNALNNFLALAADEAPQDALRELQDLQGRNPNFSPVPAQMAYIYEKLGMSDQAIENMLHAVTMEPENLTYRYNLAVMYDKAGKNQEAVELYRQIVSANIRGEHIPGNIETVQERLTFLSSNSAK